MTRIFVLFLTGFVLISGLSGCGGGGSLPTGIPSAGGGGGDGAGGGGGGDGDGGTGGGGGEVPFVTAFRVLDVADPDGVYDTLLADQMTVFSDATVGGATPMDDFLSSPNIPASGAMDYAGFLILFVGNTDNAVGASVTGPANLTVRVADRTVSGDATGFLGKPSDENGTPQVVSYEGTILISNGVLSESASGIASLSLDISGTLDDAVNTFVIGNSLTGSIYGAEGEGLSVRQAFGGSSSTVNGAPASYDQATLRAVLQTPPP